MELCKEIKERLAKMSTAELKQEMNKRISQMSLFGPEEEEILAYIRFLIEKGENLDGKN